MKELLKIAVMTKNPLIKASLLAETKRLVGKESEENFEDEMKESRKEFCNAVNKQKWNTELRTEAENFLIAFDVAVEERRKLKEALDEAITGLEWWNEHHSESSSEADLNRIEKWKKLIK